MDKNWKAQPLHHYVGNLELYFETGMESMGTIFHDDRGLYEGLKWDNPEEKMTYKSIAWSIWFGDRGCVYQAKIFNKKNKIVYEGPLTKDKRKMAKEKYRFGFLPKELTTRRWYRFCQKEYRAEIWTNYIPDPIKQEYKLEHSVGDVVFDDLTAQDAILMNVTLGKGPTKTVGYWVNNDYLGGGRHPWEITKIDWQDRWKKELEAERKKNENPESGPKSE